MSKIFIAILFTLCSFTSFAQDDSLFVMARGDGWMIPHKIVPGETVFILARRYHVPLAILAGANGLNYQTGLSENATIYIPLASYNQVKDEPSQATLARPLYYHAKGGDDLYRISRNSNVQQRTIQQWNSLNGNDVTAGQTLFVGWVAYDASQVAFPAPVPTPATTNVIPAKPVASPDTMTNIVKPNVDTARPTAATEFENLYNTQTGDNTNITTEKGPAVFFDMPGKAGNTYYAFHNITPRGTIIKVSNPGNGKTIYVKVIGPLPETKLYANSLIGISGAAKAALSDGAEEKVWCELSFKAN